MKIQFFKIILLIYMSYVRSKFLVIGQLNSHLTYFLSENKKSVSDIMALGQFEKNQLGGNKKMVMASNIYQT